MPIPGNLRDLRPICQWAESNFSSNHKILTFPFKGKYPNLDYIDKPRYSLYFPNKTIPSLRAVCKALEENQPAIPDVLAMKTTTNEELFNTLKSIYNFYHGRIPRSEQLLLYYPDYMTRFSELQRIIMTEDGPLPPDQRYFLALVVKFLFCIASLPLKFLKRACLALVVTICIICWLRVMLKLEEIWRGWMQIQQLSQIS